MRTQFCAWALAFTAVPAAANATVDLAAAFGARPAAWGVALSPDGKRISYLTPAKSGGTAVVVADTATGTAKPVMAAVASDLLPQSCGWKNDKRLVCQFYGVTVRGGTRLSFTRVLAVDADGGAIKELGQRSRLEDVIANQYSGELLNWLPDDPDNVLMAIDVPERADTGSLLPSREPGLAAFKVNVGSNRFGTVEKGNTQARELIADAQGNVRAMATIGESGGSGGYLRGTMRWFMRGKGGGQWSEFARGDILAVDAVRPLGFDESGEWLFVLKPKDGRKALFRLATDGSKREEPVFAHPQVDVDGLLRIGKYNRPVAARYVTETRQYEYFDPALAKLSRALSAALPGRPDVDILDESWDGGAKLVFAASSRNPGRYYVYRPATRELNELVPLRPQLDKLDLAASRPISFPARDGVAVPGYLTLPPRKESARGLPAIVMPHGGPGSRDDGGFDWWAQFFAASGYAVLQPNFRGSTGYGAAWFQDNGFRSWRTAIGDVNDGAKWLIAQGIADPKRVAAAGWSYGGYAALQGNVLDPGLYKAVIAVAPVTDLPMLKEDARPYTNFGLVSDMIGEGPHLTAGSPARNARAIGAPVLLFHGDKDINVAIGHSRAMERAVREAGGQVEFATYPGLDHQLDDRAARTDMLAKSAAFLAATLGPAAPAAATAGR